MLRYLASREQSNIARCPPSAKAFSSLIGAHALHFVMLCSSPHLSYLGSFFYGMSVNHVLHAARGALITACKFAVVIYIWR